MLSPKAIEEKYGLSAEESAPLKKAKDGNRRSIPDELKLKIIGFVERKAGSQVEIAEDLGIHTSNLFYWRRKFGFANPGPTKNDLAAQPSDARKGHAENGSDVNGFPTKPKSSKRKATVNFQCENVKSAILVLTGLQGQPGRVSITIE